jgi:POLQ-like helicase
LIIAAISEMLGNVVGLEAAAGTKAALSHLLKRMKYGASHPDEIALYELGFADRVAANRIGVLISDNTESPIRVRLCENDEMESILASLPRYFWECYDSVV